MKSNLYCILDVISEEFGPILECKNDAAAKRSFDMAMSKCPDPQNMQLFKIAAVTREDSAIAVNGNVAPAVVCQGVALPGDADET